MVHPIMIPRPTCPRILNQPANPALSFLKTFPIFDRSYENSFLHVYEKASKYRLDIDVGEILMKALDKCVDKEKKSNQRYVESEESEEESESEESEEESEESESENDE